MPTHEVLNQAPPLQDHDPFALDLVLQETLRREGAAWADEEVGEFARRSGSRETIAWGFQANENPPRLRTHDRFGNRIDEVEFHPAWHELMRLSIANGVPAGPWRGSPPAGRALWRLPLPNGAPPGPWREPRAGAHVARAAKMQLISQNEFGHG